MRITIIIVLLTLLINYGFSQNTVHVSFSFYIDRQAPTLVNGNLSPAEISEAGESFNFTTEWTEDYKLRNATFEWNITGVFENETASIIDDWINVTKAISNPEHEGLNVSLKIHAMDYSGNWNSTDYQELIIKSIKPDYNEVSQDSNEVTAGEQINITSYWSDNFQVTSVTLQTNYTGTWQDNGSPIQLNNKTGWANFTINTAGLNGDYYWQLVGLDAVSNSNTTPVSKFLIN